MDVANLYEMALDASKKAFCPVSDFPVGAALLAGDGRVFTGCNIESPSIIQVFCAERVALLKALSEGAGEFTAIALATPKKPCASPCGLCRQMLFEFAPDLLVYRLKSGEVVSEKVSTFLPEGFRFDKNNL